jgi:flagellar hook-basal body complex protein FliE
MPLELTNATSIGSGGSTLTRGVKSAAGAATSATSFADSLGRLIDNVEDTAAKANDAVTNMMDKTGDVHEAMIALQRAEMTLQLTVQIRNKLVQAYQDVMRMPI